MQQQLHDFWLETPIVIQKTWRDMETPEEMLRAFMIKSIERVDNTIKHIDKTFPYLDSAVQKTQKFEVKTEETPEEMLVSYMIEYIKQIQDLRTSIKKIWQKK
jgi:uncharacterized protein YoxC